MFRRLTLPERFTIALLFVGCLTMHSRMALGVEPSTEPKSESHIGKKISPFTLDNCYGRAVSLDTFTNKKAIVVAFLGTECPLAKLYGPRLEKLQQTFGTDDVAIIGINSNKQDSLSEVLAYSHRHKISFQMLKDLRNKVADAFAAERTPEVFLLDSTFTVRYHGRIDDQYYVGGSRARPESSELSDAIKQLLAGEEITVTETPVEGCHIGRIKSVQPSGSITFTKHIAPIFNNHCMRCHREGEIAPFNLTHYEDVVGWEDTIMEVIEEDRMPPWFANPKHGEFANDPRLSAEQKDLIFTWIENGMPQGNSADLPTPPVFIEGWQIAEPDQIITMPEAFPVPAEGTVDYRHFVIDPEWKEDKYIIATEARPQNRSVVHHILLHVIPPETPRRNYLKTRGPILAGYAPGAIPLTTPEGVAIKVKAGSKLLIEMHYTPNGHAQEDQSSVGICYAKDPSKIKREMKGDAASFPRRELFIEPNDPDKQVVQDSKMTKRNVALVSMTPHMHLRGKSFRYDLIDSKTGHVIETLLDVPAYDFNWQLKYILKKPKVIRPGQFIRCTAVFDNSANNLANPDPSQRVTWGPQSEDEMMIGFMDYIPL
ncbi:MAG: thiol-disulfide isomerase [Rhodopirellula sp.]|nr:thiol-disulfide isomerase [Rhodopirellula sp.]